MKKAINVIETFIEKYTPHIQIILFILLLIFGIVFPAIDMDAQITIINLSALIGFEILFLTIKSDTIQNNLHNICLDKYVNGNMVSISINENYQEFNGLLSAVEHDLFISGITCNSIWAYTATIKELLAKNYKIRILISSEQAYQSNTLIYKGDFLDKSIKNTKNKADLLFDTIISDTELNQYFENSKLEIRTTNIPFTVAYVAINIYDSNIKKQKLKITQYIAKHERGNCPSIIIDPLKNKELFSYYIDSIKDLWETSDPDIR